MRLAQARLRGPRHWEAAQLRPLAYNIESSPETFASANHRFKLLLDRSNEVKSASKYPDLTKSLQCLQHQLGLYNFMKANPGPAGFGGGLGELRQGQGVFCEYIKC